MAKIILCGDGYVGKTTIRERYIGIKFRSNYLQTIGADFTTKNQDLENGQQIKLQIWDLAGQQRFQTARKSFYKGSNGIILVFNVVTPNTADNLMNWIEEIKKNVPEPIPLVLVGNKIDLRPKVDHVITTEDGIAITQKLSTKYTDNIRYIESSALSGKNIHKIFTTIAEQVLNFERKGKSKEDTFIKFFNEITDLIQLYLYKIGSVGPQIAHYTPEKIEDHSLLIKMGIFYSTAVGQGKEAHEGLYGPLPIPVNNSTNKLQSFIFSFSKNDKIQIDPRANGQSYCFLVLTIPENLLYLLANKNVVTRFFHSELDKLTDINQINKEYLKNMKKELLRNLYLTQNS